VRLEQVEPQVEQLVLLEVLQQVALLLELVQQLVLLLLQH
jgi:hypothetical protein